MITALILLCCQCRFRIPGKNFVVVADHKLLPAVLGRPGLPKTSIYSLIGPVSQ